MSGGFPVFSKRNDPRKWLEFYAPLRRWQVKPTRGKGLDVCWAYLDSDKLGGELTDLVDMSIWTGRGEGSWWTEQPSVRMEIKDGGNKLAVSGFSGQHSRKVNGEYRKCPAEDPNVSPSFLKIGDEDKLMEYHPTTRTWQLKPAANRGKDSCWAYNVTRNKMSPHNSTNCWVIKDAYEQQTNAKISIGAFDAKLRLF